MIRSKDIFCLFVLSCIFGSACFVQGNFFDSKPEGVIALPLKRVQVNPWILNKTASLEGASCYNPLKVDTDYVHDYEIQLPQQCKEGKQDITHAKIVQSCVYVTVAYQTDFYFDSAKTDPFKMVLDLRSPWSWVKAPNCQQYSRSGESIKGSSCTFDARSVDGDQSQQFSKTYECNNSKESVCQVIPNKCGEIDHMQEGLSIFGQFISTKFVLSDKRYRKKGIKGFKLLQAFGLSGLSYLQGDGVLGLGQQHTSSKKNSKEDMNKKNNDSEDDDDTEDDQEELEQVDRFGEPTVTFSEPGTDIWSSIDRSYGSVNARVFGLYLAEHDSIPPQLLIGEKAVNATSLMHLPERFPLQWVKMPKLQYTEEDEQIAHSYFHWNVPISQIVFRYNPAKEIKSGSTIQEIVGYMNRTEILLDKESEAEISLQTSALILPEKMLNQIINKLNEIYKIDCKLSNKFIKYVQCSGLDAEINVSELAITIHVGYALEDDIFLNVDPRQILVGCKKQKGKYDCYFNLQQSANDRIILGDAAFRNSYLVFDTEGKRIGFAHAKSKFNEQSIWSELKVILGDVEDVIRGDIIFLLRFFLILIVLSTILFLFVNWKKIYLTIQRKIKYQNVSDPSKTISSGYDLDTSDMVIKHNQDDNDVADQIQELEQNESFDAL